MKFWAVDLAHYFLNGHPHLSSKKYVHDRISGQTLVCVVPITIFRAGKKYLLFQQKSAMIVGLYVCRYEVFLIFIEQSSSKNSRNFSFFYVDLEWCGVFDTSSRTYKFSAHMPQSHSVEKMWNFRSPSAWRSLDSTPGICSIFREAICQRFVKRLVSSFYLKGHLVLQGAPLEWALLGCAPLGWAPLVLNG